MAENKIETLQSHLETLSDKCYECVVVHNRMDQLFSTCSLAFMVSATHFKWSIVRPNPVAASWLFGAGLLSFCMSRPYSKFGQLYGDLERKIDFDYSANIVYPVEFDLEAARKKHSFEKNKLDQRAPWTYKQPFFPKFENWMGR